MLSMLLLLMLLLLFFFCFLLLLLSFGFCVSVDSQLTGRAHNEVKQNEAMFNDEAGDLSDKKKGLW